MVTAIRTDGTTARVESNASSAANTYCNADRPLNLSLSQLSGINVQSRLRFLANPRDH